VLDSEELVNLVALPRKDLRDPQGALQIPPLRYPGYPVETRGFDDLHAALLTESRTRGRT
jgi:hypothetical protein